MKIALLGYGKMGKTIERLLIEQYANRHSIVLKTNSANTDELSEAQLQEADVAIEFSTPHTAIDNIEKCLSAKTPVIVGTTGWYGKLAYVKRICEEQSGSIFYASNFSIGMYFFFQLNKKLAELMNEQGYKTEISETHHTTKKDKPSGTAITLAEDIIWFNKKLNKWVDDAYDLKADELPITSHRIEEVKGTHTVSYHSNIETLSITHEAHSREGFAQGAIRAAEWIQNKQGFFTLADMLDSKTNT